MNIEGRIAFVTGAARGIGRASALALAGAGAAGVALVDVDGAGLDETALLVKDKGAEAFATVADVGDLGSLRGALSAAVERFGRIDIVHNNAGIVAGDPQWPDTPVERMQRMISVNVGGALLGTRLAIDLLRDTGGVVVNTSSIASLAPMPTDPTYAATKAAITSFTQSCAPLAESLGVRVNAILPGIVDTDMVNETGDGTTPAAWLLPVLDMIERLPADDVARAVVSLIEDDTKAGETLVIANGMPAAT